VLVPAEVGCKHTYLKSLCGCHLFIGSISTLEVTASSNLLIVEPFPKSVVMASTIISVILGWCLLSIATGQDVKKANILSNDNLDSSVGKAWPLRIPLDPVLSARYQTIVQTQRNRLANLTSLDSSELELVEETTPKSSRQVGSNGFLFRNNNYNPALTPSYNPYDPLSQRIDPLNPLSPGYIPTTTYNGVNGVNGLTPRDESALDAFSARRASTFSQGRGSKIVFADTITQLGTSWNPQTSEFSPTVPGIFFFSFNAVTDRYTHFR